jgi:hypothetical protein
MLRPILNHHLVMSVERPHRGGEGATGVAPTVKGIHPRIKYAVIHSGIRASGKVRPEFVVDMATLEISRADYDGLPREGWNYGTIDEVIERVQAVERGLLWTLVSASVLGVVWWLLRRRARRLAGVGGPTETFVEPQLPVRDKDVVDLPPVGIHDLPEPPKGEADDDGDASTGPATGI